MKVEITAKLEKSDHDGYCSGEECEYKRETIKYIVNQVPNPYQTHQSGLIENIDDFDWVSLLPEPEINYSGSYYCDCSKKCEAHGLDRHDYRYTVLQVKLFSDDSELVEKLDMGKIYSD